MSKFVDLTGRRFGRLTVIKRKKTDDTNRTYWICQCDCGNIKTVEAYALKIGRTKSCGCLSVDTTPHKGSIVLSIGLFWIDDKQPPLSCPIAPLFPSIVLNRSLLNLIDRIDNNNGYSPDNCRWVDAKIQGNNKRNNLIVEFKGKPMTISQISDLTEINYEKLRKAFHSGRIYKMFNEEPEDSEV